jgi:type VI secretion system secreted protein Hcp
MAAVDYFLVLDGLNGESQDGKYKNSIEISSFQWGASNTAVSAAGSGGGAGKVSFQDIHLVKSVDKASPLLMLACASGQHIKTATLYCRKAGGEQQEYYKVTLTDVLISSYRSSGGQYVSSIQWSGSGGSGDTPAFTLENELPKGVVPADMFSLNFTKITFEYKPQKPDGTLDSPVNSSWDVKANKKG